MKGSHYLALFVRLFAIAMALFFLDRVVVLAYSLGEPSQHFSIHDVFSLVSAIFPLFVSLILWQFPLLVSRTILKSEMDGDVDGSKPTPADMLAVIVAGIGLYTLYYAVVDAVYWGALWAYTEEQKHVGQLFDINADRKANMLATGVELVAALVLLVKARVVASWIMGVPEGRRSNG